MGWFPSLWMEVETTEGRMKCVQCWVEQTLSIPIVWHSPWAHVSVLV